MGVGTSMLIKMQVEKALKALGIEANVELADISTAKGLAMSADLVVTSNELADRIGNIKTPIVTVSNFMDVNAIKEGLQAALNKNN
ncbi:MAG: PTS ascorbate transporter subunit IIB [Aliifodinibius sp.]|nr:PTS ascorbate transporter subunit IIB [Fodinibius sp.]